MKKNKVGYIKELILNDPDISNDDIKRFHGDEIASLPGILLTIDGLISKARKELQCTQEDTNS